MDVTGSIKKLHNDTGFLLVKDTGDIGSSLTYEGKEKTRIVIVIEHRGVKT